MTVSGGFHAASPRHATTTGMYPCVGPIASVSFSFGVTGNVACRPELGSAALRCRSTAVRSDARSSVPVDARTTNSRRRSSFAVAACQPRIQAGCGGRTWTGIRRRGIWDRGQVERCCGRSVSRECLQRDAHRLTATFSLPRGVSVRLRREPPSPGGGGGAPCTRGSRGSRGRTRQR